jgi:hypothetical protein
MAWEFESTAWTDWSGQVHDETPPVDASWVYGILTHWFDDETGQEDWHWNYTDAPLRTWDEWFDYIQAMGESEYGLEMA